MLRRLLFLINPVAFFLFVPLAYGQDFQADPLSMAGQASLLNFRYEFGDRSARLFVVGHEAAKINFDLVEITAFKDSLTKQELRFSPERGYFVIENPPKWEGPFELRLKAKIKDEEQTVLLKVKN